MGTNSNQRDLAAIEALLGSEADALLSHRCQTVDKSPSYTTWNAGASYQLKKLSLDLRYYDTKGDKFGNISKARVVAGAKLTF